MQMVTDYSQIYEKLEVPSKHFDVLVLVHTFRSSKTILSCLDSIFAQEFDGTLAVLVHDDASDDDTLDLVTEYRDKRAYPIFIMKRFVNAHGADQWDHISTLQFSYIAVCDGDDFWISSDKIQKQFSLMEGKRKLALCYHGFVEYNSEGLKIISKRFDSLDEWPRLTRMLFTAAMMPIGSCTLFIRKDCLNLDNMRLSEKYLVGDLILIYSALQHGSSMYVAGLRSGYRAGGFWSSKSEAIQVRTTINLLFDLMLYLKTSVKFRVGFRLILEIVRLANLNVRSLVKIRTK